MCSRELLFCVQFSVGLSVACLLFQAIECGSIQNFHRSLDDMSAFFAKHPRIALSDRYLDVCIKKTVVVSRHTRVRCYHYMSLLAYAALYNHKEMVDILIERKACKLHAL